MIDFYLFGNINRVCNNVLIAPANFGAYGI